MKKFFQWLSLATIVLSPICLPFKTLASVNEKSESKYQLRNGVIAQAEANKFELKDFKFWSSQCLSLTEGKQYTQALTACEQAISLKPKDKNTELWSARSLSLFYTGKYAESLPSFERVVINAPYNSFAIAYQCAALFELDKYEDAIGKCDGALQVNGNWGNTSPSFALVYKGLAFRKLGRLENALLSYNSARAVSPDNSFIKAERCSLIAEMGEASPEKDCNLKNAIQDYELAFASDSSNPIVSIQQGLALEQVGLFERALTAYTRAIQLNPQNAYALARRCGTLNALEDYKAALESCDNALANIQQLKKSDITYLLTQRSGTLIGLEKYEDALANADRAIAISPDYAYAYTARAVSLWGLKDFIEARKVILQAINIFDKNHSQSKGVFLEVFARQVNDTLIESYRGLFLARYNQGRILASTVFARGDKYKLEAQNAYELALKSFRDYRRELKIDNHYLESNLGIFDKRLLSNVYANQSAAYLRLNSYQKAFDVADKATAINPDSFAGWYNKALALSKLSKLNENDKALVAKALVAYEKAEKLSPNNKYVLTGKGLILQKEERLADALAAFDKVLGLEPDNILIITRKGAILQKMGRFQEAVAIYDLVLGNEPKNLNILLEKGLALQNLLKFEEAIAIYNKILSDKSNANNVYVMTAKAKALENLGKKPEAIALYKQVLDIRPSYVPAKERLEVLNKPGQ